MTQSSSKEAPDLPQKQTTVSLWDLVGEKPAVTPLKSDTIDDSLYPVEMSCSVPSGIVRLRMPMRHLSQVIEWLQLHVDAQLASASDWKNRNRKSMLARQRSKRRAKSSDVREPTSESRCAKAGYMRTYRANIALLKRDMKGEQLTRDERASVDKHKARISAKDKRDRQAKWKADRAAARAMLKAGHIFTPKG